MQKKAAIIFVFNHRYDKNIEILESIYKNRFSHIYHLVPFYDGDKPNVIPVYESSFYFQGYIAQGFKHYFHEEFEHYLFVADDMILNPSINENNYREHFKLTEKASYIPEIFPLHNLHNNNTLHFEIFTDKQGKSEKRYWWRIKEAIKYQHEKEGIEVRHEMPSYEAARTIFASHGYELRPLGYNDVYGGIYPFSISSGQNIKHLKTYLKNLRSFKKEYHLSYPIVGSYSDIVIVSKVSIKQFCHYCGVFAANGLFVEFAIPSALLLASEEVVTEPKLGKRGSIFWTYAWAGNKDQIQEYEDLMQYYDYNLKKLLSDFPLDKLYIHPIKLSKWKN